MPLLAEIFLKKSSEEWSEVFRGVSFPYGPVNDMREVFGDPQVQHSQLAQYVDHPTVGRVCPRRRSFVGAASTAPPRTPHPSAPLKYSFCRIFQDLPEVRIVQKYQ